MKKIHLFVLTDAEMVDALFKQKKSLLVHKIINIQQLNNVAVFGLKQQSQV